MAKRGTPKRDTAAKQIRGGNGRFVGGNIPVNRVILHPGRGRNRR